MKDVLLVYENDSTMKIIKEDRSKLISIAGIRKIVFKPSAPFGKGYLYGAAFGFLTGFIPVAFTKGGGHPDFSGPGVGVIVGLALSIPAGLVGGVVGVLTAFEEAVIFDDGNHPAKVKKIKFLIHKHKN
jgi:hypothetical protein